MASEPTTGLNRFDTASPDSEHTGVWAKGRAWLALPPAALGRLLVLLGSLALIKTVLLIGLRKHLQEIHWRTSGDSLNWLGMFAFYALAVVLVYNLVQFGRRCQPGGVRAVRVANALILAFGGLLIFLAFHEGDKNYIYPVMTGVLKWSDLTPYLSLNLFFRPPYLAVWMFAYAAGYYVLWRSGRERQVLSMTAGFAGLYWLVCWQEFMTRRGDLWVVLMFGLVSAFLLRSSRRVFHPVWLLVPVAWTVGLWGLLALAQPDVGRLPPYFRILAGCLVVLFLGASLLAKREGFVGPWLNVFGFCFVAVLLLSSANYPKAVNLNNLVGFAAKFPHYFRGELLLTGWVALMAVVYARLRPNGGWWWLDVAALGLIVLAILDLRLTQIMGVRLGWDLITFGNDPKVMWRMARPYLTLLLVGLAVVTMCYLLAVRMARTWLGRARAESPGRQALSSGWCLLGCFSLFAMLSPLIAKPDNAEGQSALRLVQTSPIWKLAASRALNPEDFAKEARALGMPDWGAPMAGTVESPRDLNVLLIFQESTYNQHLSLFGGALPTQPRLSQYRERMELFPNFFSSFAGSIHARFATFTGLYPVPEFNRFTLERVPVKSLFEVLGENGYECSMFYSSHYDYTGFRDFLKNRRLTLMYDADTMPGAESAERVSWGLKEESTAQAIRQQIRTYANSGQRFFLTYVPAAPHYPYDKIPKEFREFKLGRVGDYTPYYLNELLYMDWIITSLVDELRDTGLLDQTLVVITSDHGEMLGENGGPLGHGWRVTPELANVPLILMDPGHRNCRTNLAVGSQVDLLPTVLDVLGLPLPTGELYQGRTLYDANRATKRPFYLNSYDEFALVVGQEIHTGSRKQEAGGQAGLIYELSNVGPKTVFTETNAEPLTISIKRFDDFQRGLLHNYSYYREALQPPQATNIVHLTR